MDSRQGNWFNRNQLLRPPLELAFRVEGICRRILDYATKRRAPARCTYASICKGCLQNARNGRCHGFIVSITSLHPERSIFTRFIPAQYSGQGMGMWRHYYEHWASMTVDELGADMINVVPSLRDLPHLPASSTSMSIPRGPGAICTGSFAAPESIPSLLPAERPMSACSQL
jgi:hypothetical protein